MESQENDTSCSECDRTIQLGEDFWFAEKCVLGPRGVIPLDELFYFCSQKCIAKFFDSTDAAENVFSSRIP